MEPGNAGLSNYGREVVERLNAEKLVIDLSHASPRTTKEAIRASGAPMLIGHIGCRALADLPRNVHDAELRALADKGGVAGIIFWPYLRVDTQPMAIDVIRTSNTPLMLATKIMLASAPMVELLPRNVHRNGSATIAHGCADRSKTASSRQRGQTICTRLFPTSMSPTASSLWRRHFQKPGHSDARIEKLLGRNFASVMREVWGD